MNIGSIDSVTGTSLTSAYTMSKFGIRGLTKVTALENAAVRRPRQHRVPRRRQPGDAPAHRRVGRPAATALRRRCIPERMGPGRRRSRPRRSTLRPTSRACQRRRAGARRRPDAPGCSCPSPTSSSSLHPPLRGTTDPRSAAADEIVLSTWRTASRLVTLNRPEARNALNGELIAAMRAAWRSAAPTTTCRRSILTGNDPAFCAGLDLGYLADRVERRRRRRGTSLPRVAGAAAPEADHRRGQRARGHRRARGRARRATSWWRRSGPASPTPTPGSASCPAGASRSRSPTRSGCAGPRR